MAANDNLPPRPLVRILRVIRADGHVEPLRVIRGGRAPVLSAGRA